MSQEPGQSVWNRFWDKKSDLKKVYPTSPALLKAMLGYLQEKGAELSTLRILEVGAGTGRDSAELARLGAQVTVLDFAEGSLALVEKTRQELGLRNLHLVRGDAFHAPFAEGSFDVVFHQGLAEHFKNPLPLIQENFRILRPGGILLCDVPQAVHPYTVLKKILIAFDKWFAGWETQFTLGSLEKLLRQAGFEAERHYGDWMRPNLFYRCVREAAFKAGVEMPLYPLQGTGYQKIKDKILDKFSQTTISRYTQINIGVIGVKPISIKPSGVNP
jgi:SAM-dependent methyltransferase